MLTIYQQF